MYQLRTYQQEAVVAAISWLKSTTEPGLMEAYTAAGKSLIVAEIARIITEMTGKKTLVLQPGKELLKQNAAKYKLTGEPYSLFSASANSKSVRNNVVFGTALSVKNHLKSFCDKFCLVILDEADVSLTPTILSIIKHMREQNPMLRVLGLTSSPYKMGSGYIYRLDINNNPMPESKCRDPFFTKQIVHIKGRDLLEQGYVSPIVVPAINEHYDTSGLELNSMGKFTSDSLDRAFLGQGRKTAGIINDLVKQTQEQNRVSGLIFASTHKHAEEIYESLPKHLTAIVTDKTKPKERERIVKAHGNLETKYLINVGIFGRGTDFPRLDFIALLCATESSARLHQFIGRLARIHPDKINGAVFDYAGNIDNHHPDGDLFNPKITTWNAKGEGGEIKVICPHCQTENIFTARPNEDGFEYSEDGYFVDLMGEKIQSEYGPMPSHFGRRCLGMQMLRGGTYERCGYYWTYKECPECFEKSDIAARYCPNKHELIDPNKSLIIEYRRMRKDPHIKQTEQVLNWNKKKTLSSKGNECLQVNYVTEYREISIWYQPKGESQYLLNEYNRFMKYTNGGDIMPKSLTYQKQPNGFYRVFSYNEIVPESPVV